MSYTRSETFAMLLAYEAGELSIGQMARLLACDLVEVRELRDAVMRRGVKAAEEGPDPAEQGRLTADELQYLRSMD